MTPAARIQAVIEVLSMVQNGTKNATQALQHWGHTHRFAGSGDRRAIADTLYDVLRSYYAYSEAMGDTHPRALVLAWLRFGKNASLDDIEHLFSGAQYHPGVLRDAERAALQQLRLPKPSFAALCNMPADIEPLLGDKAYSDDLAALNERAPFDLRVNTLKTSRDKVLMAFKKHEAQATCYSPWGVRLPQAVSLQDNALYLNGNIEVQDEGSQLAALLCNVQPQQRVLDYCAGAGGKTLALAAMLHNKGEIIASDVSQERLKNLTQRAKRAGVGCVRIMQNDRLQPDKGLFDRVVVDAPCTGSGTRRRNPEALLHLTPAQVQQYAHTQAQLLKKASAFLAVEGWLIYITCSVFAAENETIADDFAQQHTHFSPLNMQQVWQQVLPPKKVACPAGVQQYARLRTSEIGADSFFIAAWQRRA